MLKKSLKLNTIEDRQLNMITMTEIIKQLHIDMISSHKFSGGKTLNTNKKNDRIKLWWDHEIDVIHNQLKDLKVEANYNNNDQIKQQIKELTKS